MIDEHVHVYALSLRPKDGGLPATRDYHSAELLPLDASLSQPTLQLKC